VRQLAIELAGKTGQPQPTVRSFSVAVWFGFGLFPVAPTEPSNTSHENKGADNPMHTYPVKMTDIVESASGVYQERHTPYI
jgi:hypothetical protein